MNTQFALLPLLNNELQSLRQAISGRIDRALNFSARAQSGTLQNELRSLSGHGEFIDGLASCHDGNVPARQAYAIILRTPGGMGGASEQSGPDFC